MKFKVPITDYVASPAVFEEKVLADLADLPCLEQVEESGLAGKIEDADALIVFHTIRVSSASIRRLRKCRAIVRCGVGYDNVDLAAAGEKGIYVCNVPDYGVDEVADHAIALMLACARGLPFTERRLRMSCPPGIIWPPLPSGDFPVRPWGSSDWEESDGHCPSGQGPPDESGGQ